MSAFYCSFDGAESTLTIHRALELGVSFPDTADVYGPFTNESLVGKAIASRRDDHSAEQALGQGGEAGHRVRVGRGDEIDRDLVGARVQTPSEPGPDACSAAVQDEQVDEPVASPTGQVGVVEAERAQVVGVVDQAEIGLLDRWSAD